MVKDNLAYALKEEFLQEANFENIPVKYCSVSLSDLIRAEKRLDAQRYDIDLRQAQDTILNSKFGTKKILGETDGMCTAYRP